MGAEHGRAAFQGVHRLDPCGNVLTGQLTNESGSIVQKFAVDRGNGSRRAKAFKQVLKYAHVECVERGSIS